MTQIGEISRIIGGTLTGVGATMVASDLAEDAMRERPVKTDRASAIVLGAGLAVAGLSGLPAREFASMGGGGAVIGVGFGLIFGAARGKERPEPKRSNEPTFKPWTNPFDGDVPPRGSTPTLKGLPDRPTWLGDPGIIAPARPNLDPKIAVPPPAGFNDDGIEAKPWGPPDPLTSV